MVDSFFCCNFAEKKKEKEYEEDICFDGGDTDGVHHNDGKGTEDAGGDDHTSGAKCGGANEGEGPVALPGVKKVEADFAAKQVMVTYDADKTNAKKIVAALKKNGYEATVVSDGAPKEKKEVPVDATSGASQQQKK